MRPGGKTFFAFFVPFFIFLCDRLFKFLFFKIPLFNDKGIFLFGGIIRFNLVTNPGVAFGLLLNSYIFWTLWCLIFVLLVWFWVYFYHQNKIRDLFFIGLVIFGAFSNILDRFYFGHVIDYVSVKYFSIFNLADAMIVVGVLLFIFFNFKLRRV